VTVNHQVENRYGFKFTERSIAQEPEEGRIGIDKHAIMLNRYRFAIVIMAGV
jgi:hypothetical protein